MIEAFSFTKFSRGTPKFDPDELIRLNTKIIHQTSFNEVKTRLAQMGLQDLDENFWNAVRANLEKVSDIKEWWTVAKGPVESVINDPDFAEKALELMPPEPWSNQTWKQWTEAIKGATGRKGKELFMPLRQALTGRDHGPELGDLLPLIGPDEARARLQKKAA